MYNNYGFIITWSLHQIIMYSNKVKLKAGENNDPSHPLLFVASPPPPIGWTNWPISDVQVSNLNWRQFFSCHNIHVYIISIIIILYLGKQPLIQHQDPSYIHTKIIFIIFLNILCSLWQNMNIIYNLHSKKDNTER